MHIRGQNHQPAAFRLLEDPLQAVVEGLLDNSAAVFGTKSDPAQRPEQAGKVRDLRDGGHRTARICARTGPLFDGNYRSQALNVIHLRTLHLLHDLPGPRGQAVHELPVAFRKQGIKGQRRFARSAHTGDHDQLLAGNRDVQALQVVHPCAFDMNDFFHEC